MSTPRDVDDDDRSGRLWLAAIILGVLALAGALFPFINFLSVVLALVGVLLAITEISRRPRGRRRPAIIALLVAGFALVFSGTVVVLYTIELVSASGRAG